VKIVVNARFLTRRITGVQRYAIEISLILKQIYGNKIIFVAPKKGIIYKDIAKKLDVQLFGNLTGLAWEQLELPLYLYKKHNPVLLGLANTAPIIYNKNVFAIHDLIFMKDPEWCQKKFAIIYKLGIPILLKTALKVLTVSQYSKNDIIKTFNTPAEKIEVVYNAVSEEFLEYAAKNYEKKYENYILAVISFLNPRKNLDRIIKAFNIAELTDIKLVIAGIDAKNYEHKELLNDNVIFTGYKKDKELAQLYKNAKFLVFPSLFEGFGIPPLEAMSCGCPVIASNTTSLPEVCTDAAYYVDPTDIKNIAEAIKRFAKDKELRESLKEKGFKRVELFNWAASADKIAKILEKL